MRVERASKKPSATTAPQAALLSPQRAFVVQFRTVTKGELAPFEGRVEHMPSGQAARFASPKELTAFLQRVLRTLPEGALQE